MTVSNDRTVIHDTASLSTRRLGVEVEPLQWSSPSGWGQGDHRRPRRQADTSAPVCDAHLPAAPVVGSRGNHPASGDPTGLIDLLQGVGPLHEIVDAQLIAERHHRVTRANREENHLRAIRS